MADTFVKLWASILDSSVWSEDPQIRLVWITMLVMADENGFVGASVDGLARRANVPEEAVAAALEAFQSPDPKSRSKESEGRRIEPVERGWHIINHGYFRNLRDAEVRKAYERERKKSYRERVRDTSGTEAGPYAYASSDASGTSKKRTKKPAPEGFDEFWKAYAKDSDKKRAKVAWEKNVPMDQISLVIERASAYHKACIDADHPQKHAATWLNGECWNDNDLPKPLSQRTSKKQADRDRITKIEPLGTGAWGHKAVLEEGEW